MQKSTLHETLLLINQDLEKRGETDGVAINWNDWNFHMATVSGIVVI